MSLLTRPKVRFDPQAEDSGAIQAELMSNGKIRIITDVDALHLHTTWLAPAELRELCTELLGLADASDAIHAEA